MPSRLPVRFYFDIKPFTDVYDWSSPLAFLVVKPLIGERVMHHSVGCHLVTDIIVAETHVRVLLEESPILPVEKRSSQALYRAEDLTDKRGSNPSGHP